MIRVSLAALAFLLGSLGIGGDQKLTADRLLALHRDEALHGWSLPAGGERRLAGECTTTTPARAAGTLVGPFRFVSSGASSSLVVKFGTDLYEGERVASDGTQVDIGFAQGRTSSRSALGLFLNIHPVIVGEGLLGGVWNARWPLLDAQSRGATLGYDGLKKLDGRELYRLRYRARQRQGDLDISVYFEPGSYRHVATIYTASQAQAMGATPESSSQQQDLHFRLEERFSEFERTGTSGTLPRIWVVRYERSGNTSNEWTYEFKLQTVE